MSRREALALPKKVTLEQARVLIDWSDGHGSVFQNRGLRESCPCALCKGEPPAIGLSAVIPLTPLAPEGVRAVAHSLVGRYAISFVWSDGHSTGIYPFEYLLSLCECAKCAASRVTEAGRA